MSGRRPLSIAVAQPLIVSHDVAGNAERHASVVRTSGARVIVFPELSLTGYELDAEPLDPTDPRLGPLVDACRDAGAVALVGAPVAAAGGAAHLATLCVDGGGASVAYRKRFLGVAEADRFTPGDAPVVLVVDGWRLGLAICKDTGVERHAAETAALGIDAYVAGVLESADDAEVQPERARRIRRQHRVWVAVASFAGSTGGGFDRAAGGSFVLAPDGDFVAQADASADAVVRATLTD